MHDSTITRQASFSESRTPPVLRVLWSPEDGAQEGQAFALVANNLFGRDPGVRGTTIDDGAVSRKHMRIRWHARYALAELIDLGSKNGTMVNGLVTVRRFLESGDIIRIGDTLLAVAPAEEAPPAKDPIPALVGDSPVLWEVKRQLGLAASATLPVLLLGETGTGKELAARALHELSGRPGSFEAVNCASVPETLFESTFFGHLRGAFTGATDDSPGLLRRCHRGTLFLDEVGEMPSPMQPKLLRFLEDGLVRPVGGAEQVHSDVRIIAATNASLKRLERVVGGLVERRAVAGP